MVGKGIRCIGSRELQSMETDVNGCADRCRKNETSMFSYSKGSACGVDDNGDFACFCTCERMASPIGTCETRTESSFDLFRFTRTGKNIVFIVDDGCVIPNIFTNQLTN